MVKNDKPLICGILYFMKYIGTIKQVEALTNRSFANFNWTNTSVDDILGEEWKDIIDYEGLYQISNKGRIKSVSKTLPGVLGGSYVKNEIILLPYIKEYPTITLRVKSDGKMRALHRILAIHFIPNPQNKKFVNHKDGDKFNCDIDNLEWATSSENQIHSFASGLSKARKGVENNMTKLSETEVIEIFGSVLSISGLSKKHNVHKTCIAFIKSGKTWGWLTGKEYKPKKRQINIPYSK